MPPSPPRAARGKTADPGARHSAVGADPGLSLDHRDRVRRAVSGQPAWLRMRRDLRDLHLAGLEHDVQPVPIVPRRADGSARGGAHVPPDAVAEFLAARSALRHAATDLEHDDVGVGRLVLRGGLRGDQRRRPRRQAAGHRLLHRRGDRTARPRRRVLCHRRHAGADPDLRSDPVPAAARLVAEIQGRGDRRRRGRAALVPLDAAKGAAVRAGRGRDRLSAHADEPGAPQPAAIAAPAGAADGGVAKVARAPVRLCCGTRAAADRRSTRRGRSSNSSAPR